MSDYFFYDINKKMADLAKRQQLAEDAQAAPAKPASNRLMEAAADYSAKKAAAGKDIGKPGKNFSKIAAGAAKKYGSAEAGKRVAGAVLNKLRHPTESIDQAQLKPWKATMKEGGKPDFLDLDKDGNRKEPMKSAARSAKKGMDEGAWQPVDEPVAKPMAKASAPKPNPNVPGSMIKVGPDTGPVKKTQTPKVPGYNDSVPVDEPVAKIKKPANEGGVPMTPKQKKFAALAKPFDKISFADRIVGAKKEVDEMLGDVAANAMKKAVRGRNRDMDETSDWSKLHEPFSKDKQPGKTWHGHQHDVEELVPGQKGNEWSGGARRVTRRKDPNTGYSVGADDETPSSGKVGRKSVGSGQGTKIGAKINRGTSKLMTDEDMFEPRDPGEYDNEGGMAKDDIKTIVRHAQALEQILSDQDNLPEWVQAKLAKIEGMMTAVDDYMQNQQGDDMGDEMDEESTNKRDNRAERAGRKVAKDIEYDEKKKDGIHGKRRGSEDSRAERAGRRVTKDIEYDEKHKKNESSNQHFDKGYYDSMDAAKKDNPKSIVKARKQPFEEESTNKRDSRAERAGRKVAKDIEYDEREKDGIHGRRRGSEDDNAERAGRRVTKDIEYDEKKKKKKKEVDETTSSGSVATSSAAPKSSGGVSYGKGIYDSLNRQLENMISESMNINMSMNNDEHGGPKKSLTVTATDEDAVMLSSLLKMAGLGNDDDHIHDMTGDDSQMLAIQTMGDEEACPSCGSSSCGCDSEEMYEGLYDAGGKAIVGAAAKKFAPEVEQWFAQIAKDSGHPVDAIRNVFANNAAKKAASDAASDAHMATNGEANFQKLLDKIRQDPAKYNWEEPAAMNRAKPDADKILDMIRNRSSNVPPVDEDRWGAEQPPKLPNDMSVTGDGGVDVNKDGSNWVYKSKEPGGRVTVTIPAKASNKMFPKTDVDEAYGDTDASENEPDWPTDEEGTDDAMMYSGGLNGPKSTGQTTTPIIAHQDDRMGSDGDHELRRMMKIAGLR